MTARWPQHHLVAAMVVALIAAPRWPVVVPLIAVLAWVTQPRLGWSAVAVVVVLTAAVGGTWRVAHAWDRAGAPMRQGATVRPGETVEVLEAPTQTVSGGWRFDGRLRGATVDVRTPVSETPPAVRIGTLVRTRGRLRWLSDDAVGPRSRGIALAVDAAIVGTAGQRGGWRGVVDRVRERAEGTLSSHSRHAARAALLRGMVLGQDDAFTAEQEDMYRRSGLSHLVAASGQNVALVAAIVVGLGTLIGIGRGWRLGWAIVAVAVYVPLAGAGPSIRRAGVMGVLTLLALALGRIADRWWALLLAALVTVLVDPFSPQQLGWQLSFAAVVGLLLIVDPLAAAARRIGLPGWVGQLLAVPLGAGLATAPVLAAGVGDVSLTSLGANIIVEPLVAPITWLGMVAGVLGPEGAPVSGWLVAVTGPPLDWVNGVAVWAGTPSWAVTRPGPVIASLPVVVFGVVLTVVARPGWLVRLGDRARVRLVGVPGARALGVGRGSPRRGRLVGSFAAVMLVVAIGTRWGWGHDGATQDAGRLRGDGVVVLDVGQGSATVLRQGGSTILIDAGPAHGRVLDRLAAQGVTRIDAIVLSHAAADHTGGAPAVARRMRPTLLVDGTDGHDDAPTEVAAAAVRESGGRVVTARRGMRIRVGRLRVEVRWPPVRPGPPAAGEDPNDRATVIRADVAGLRVLVPSDREGVPLRRAAGGPVDLLVLPHHGSADDDVPALLQTLRPRLVVAQVGRDNGYGHPAPSTRAAIVAAGVPFRRTDRDGSVVVAAPHGRGPAP